jgi:hypothetical protein
MTSDNEFVTTLELTSSVTKSDLSSGLVLKASEEWACEVTTAAEALKGINSVYHVCIISSVFTDALVIGTNIKGLTFQNLGPGSVVTVC